jgi:hypothetical protein
VLDAGPDGFMGSDSSPNPGMLLDAGMESTSMAGRDMSGFFGDFLGDRVPLVDF